jgi:hypothetical protein
MAADVKNWLFSVADVKQMTKAGVLCEDDRVELLEGRDRRADPFPRAAIQVTEFLPV